MIKPTLEKYFIHFAEGKNGNIQFSNHDSEYIKRIRAKKLKVTTVEEVLNDNRRINLVISDWFLDYSVEQDREMLNAYFFCGFCPGYYSSDYIFSDLLLEIRFVFKDECLYVVDENGYETDDIFSSAIRFLCLHSYYITHVNRGFSGFLSALCDYFSNRYPIMKEVVRAIEKDGVILPDLPPLKRLFQFNSVEELIRHIMPEANEYQENDDEDLNNRYIKAFLYTTVLESDLSELQRESKISYFDKDTIMQDDSFFIDDQMENPVCAVVDGYNVWSYLVTDVKNQFNEDAFFYSAMELINAYRNMCRNKQTKPRLHLSEDELREIERYITNVELEQDIKNPLLPSDSVFNTIIPLLPPSIRVIKSSEELYLEEVNMDNYVWHYCRDDVRAGHILILHWTFDEDYTVFIDCKHGFNTVKPSFYVAYIGGKGDTKASLKAENTINGIIVECNMKMYLKRDKADQE